MVEHLNVDGETGGARFSKTRGHSSFILLVESSDSMVAEPPGLTMSALRQKADAELQACRVRYGPKADSCTAANNVLFLMPAWTSLAD
jgi:hypothetical protein